MGRLRCNCHAIPRCVMPLMRSGGAHRVGVTGRAPAQWQATATTHALGKPMPWQRRLQLACTHTLWCRQKIQSHTVCALARICWPYWQHDIERHMQHNTITTQASPWQAAANASAAYGGRRDAQQLHARGDANYRCQMCKCKRAATRNEPGHCAAHRFRVLLRSRAVTHIVLCRQPAIQNAQAVGAMMGNATTGQLPASTYRAESAL
jgi:hypothetical protein